MRQFIICGVAAAAALAVVARADAALIEDHFETPDTIGNNPAGWTVTETNAVDVGVIDTAGDTPSSPDPLGTQALNLTANGKAVHSFDSQSSGQFRAEAYVRINSAVNSNNTSNYLSLLVYGAGTGMYVRIIGTTFNYYNGATNVALPNFTMTVGDWYDVALTADMDQSRWEFSVTDLNHPSQSASASNLAFFSDGATNLSRLAFQSYASNFTVDATIDHVRVANVPEPASLSLLGLGGLLLIRRRQ